MVKNVEEAAATISVEERADDTLAFNIEVPNDIADVPKESLSDKAKNFIKNTFNEDTQKSTDVTGDTSGNNRGRPKGAKKTSGFTFSTQVEMISIGAITLMSMFTPDSWKTVYQVNDETFSLMPSKEQASSILLPLLRIADRHSHFDKANPDVADLLFMVAALVAYSFDFSAHSMMINAMQKAEIDAQRQANATSGNSFSAGPQI